MYLLVLVVCEILVVFYFLQVYANKVYILIIWQRHRKNIKVWVTEQLLLRVIFVSWDVLSFFPVNSDEFLATLTRK